MLAFFRQILVILLVLLQYAAPVVHAHTGNDREQQGLHLYEFETLRYSSVDRLMKSVNLIPDSQSSIVNIGSAIKQQVEHFYPDNAVEITSNPSFSPINFSCLVIFPAQSTIFISPVTLNHNHCRAPPV